MFAGLQTQGEAVFMIDELKRFFPSTIHPIYRELSKACPEVMLMCSELFQQGGNAGLSVVWNDQRPANVAPTALSESTAWAVGRLKHHADLQKVRMWGPGSTTEPYLFTCELPDGSNQLVRTQPND